MHTINLCFLQNFTTNNNNNNNWLFSAIDLIYNVYFSSMLILGYKQYRKYLFLKI